MEVGQFAEHVYQSIGKWRLRIGIGFRYETSVVEVVREGVSQVAMVRVESAQVGYGVPKSTEKCLSNEET